MRLIVSISKHHPLEVLHKYFEEKAIKRAYTQNSMSRDTVITLKCVDFLGLASPGYDSAKDKTVAELLEQGIKFESLPFLEVETLSNGDVEVVSNGGAHEGRHRIRALLNLGVSELPIRLLSSERGEAPAYRWGSTSNRPKLLYGHNRYCVPFPKIETY
jgi:hypothetical protein